MQWSKYLINSVNKTNIPAIYASTYSTPLRTAAKDSLNLYHVEASLDVQSRMYSPGNTQEPFYYILEKPTTDSDIASENCGPSSEKKPAFDMLEDYCSGEGIKESTNSDTEPVYNVLEDPNLDEAQYGPMRSEEPIYHTLEGPLSDDP